MADGDFRDPWGPGPHFSKRDLLEVAVQCGAICTARLDGEELPYEHARFQAEELEADGLFIRLALTDPPLLSGVENLLFWRATALGRRTVAP